MVSTHGQLFTLSVIEPKGQGNFGKRDKHQHLKVIALRSGDNHDFTSVFAMSRGVGWLADFIESRADNRIIRPRANYVGSAFRKT